MRQEFSSVQQDSRAAQGSAVIWPQEFITKMGGKETENLCKEDKATTVHSGYESRARKYDSQDKGEKSSEYMEVKNKGVGWM